MPVAYNRRDHSTRITCSRCGSYRDVPGVRVPLQNAQDSDGNPVHEWLRWLPARLTWHSQCRDCERAAARRRPRTARVPRTTTSTGPNPNRKFGVEIECYLPRTVTRQQVINTLAAEGITVTTGYGSTGWRIKGDGSLTSGGGIGGGGCEVVSPPLTGEAGMQQLATVLRVLRDLGAVVDRSCGTHVHHDAADLTVEQIKRTVIGWYRNQSIIDGLVAPSRRAAMNPTYCGPLRGEDITRVERCNTLSQIRNVPINRYKTFNLTAYGKYGTLEIRQHQGTLNYEKIRSWVRLGQAIIDTARQGEIPATSRIRDLIAALGERMDETARTFTLGRAVEFGAVAI